jgi:hypothetical protein
MKAIQWYPLLTAGPPDVRPHQNMNRVKLDAFDTIAIRISYVTVAGCATPRDNELCAARRPPGAVGRHPALHRDVTRVDAAIPVRRSVHCTVLDFSVSPHCTI